MEGGLAWGAILDAVFITIESIKCNAIIKLNTWTTMSDYTQESCYNKLLLLKALEKFQRRSFQLVSAFKVKSLETIDREIVDKL